MGGDQEEGGEADGAERVGRDELEGEQQGEVAGRHQRIDDAGRARAGRRRAPRPTTRRTRPARSPPRSWSGKSTTATAARATIATARRAIANTTIGAADSIGIRRIRRPRRSRTRTRAQLQRRGGGAGGVDRPVDGAAVATLHEGLVVLVGGGVAAGEQEGEQGGAARGRHGHERAPPQEREQRVLGEVDQLAADQVDHAEARVEARLVGEEEDHAHEKQWREPQVESQSAHSHTVESVSVLVITSKSPYAVRALSELARRGDSAPVPIGDLARAREIPVQFLEGLFATLRRAGILQSQRGVKGGYSFARPPSEVTAPRDRGPARGRARAPRQPPPARSGPRPPTPCEPSSPARRSPTWRSARRATRRRRCTTSSQPRAVLRSMGTGRPSRVFPGEDHPCRVWATGAEAAEAGAPVPCGVSPSPRRPAHLPDAVGLCRGKSLFPARGR